VNVPLVLVVASVPLTVVQPGSVTAILMLAGLTALLNVARTVVVFDAVAAPFAGVMADTVGAVSVVKLQKASVMGVLGADGVDVVGWTVRLPMPAATGGNAAEAERLAKAGLAVRTLPTWFSHLTGSDYDRLRATLFTGTRLRIGTELWLGGSVARRTVATVLDVHKVKRGDKVGYWQRTMPADGHLVVVSGGTAHGIALEAPTSAATTRQRVISAVNGSVEALGWARSPFTIGGKKRWFVEPPHMQASMVFLPGSRSVPAVGDEIPVELRLTTATVDEVVLED
jgi:hypothetical protein